jgi:transposase
MLEAHPRGRGGLSGTELLAKKESVFEVCPKCATPSSSVYDHRWVRLRDDPLRTRQTILWVRKRRFSCKPCKKPFTEPVDGVRKGYARRSATVGDCSGPASTSAI